MSKSVAPVAAAVVTPLDQTLVDNGDGTYTLTMGSRTFQLSAVQLGDLGLSPQQFGRAAMKIRSLFEAASTSGA